MKKLDLLHSKYVLHEERENIGTVLGQRLTSALTGLGIPYKKLSDIIYGELRDISKEQVDGDWLEMPNGDTYTKTYTVGKDKKINK